MDGALMQPEFNKNIEHDTAPHYSNPKTSGAIQDELRKQNTNEENSDLKR